MRSQTPSSSALDQQAWQSCARWHDTPKSAIDKALDQEIDRIQAEQTAATYELEDFDALEIDSDEQHRIPTKRVRITGREGWVSASEKGSDDDEEEESDDRDNDEKRRTVESPIDLLGGHTAKTLTMHAAYGKELLQLVRDATAAEMSEPLLPPSIPAKFKPSFMSKSQPSLPTVPHKYPRKANAVTPKSTLSTSSNNRGS